jgi:hypothetical protein
MFVNFFFLCFTTHTVCNFFFFAIFELSLGVFEFWNNLFDFVSSSNCKKVPHLLISLGERRMAHCFLIVLRNIGKFSLRFFYEFHIFHFWKVFIPFFSSPTRRLGHLIKIRVSFNEQWTIFWDKNVWFTVTFPLIPLDDDICTIVVTFLTSQIRPR